jgi:dCMP deaminase
MRYNTRPTTEQYFLMLAQVAATKGTCARRKVGCILVDRHGHVLATGYNGPAAGEPHCIEHNCPGANMAPGTGLSTCEAIHAEANALLQCKDSQAIDVVYCTSSPCRDCVKLLMNTSARAVYFLEEYWHTDAKELWTRSKARGWYHYEWLDNPLKDLDLKSCVI